MVTWASDFTVVPISPPVPLARPAARVDKTTFSASWWSAVISAVFAFSVFPLPISTLVTWSVSTKAVATAPDTTPPEPAVDDA